MKFNSFYKMETKFQIFLSMYISKIFRDPKLRFVKIDPIKKILKYELDIKEFPIYIDGLCITKQIFLFDYSDNHVYELGKIGIYRVSPFKIMTCKSNTSYCDESYISEGGEVIKCDRNCNAELCGCHHSLECSDYRCRCKMWCNKCYGEFNEDINNYPNILNKEIVLNTFISKKGGYKLPPKILKVRNKTSEINANNIDLTYESIQNRLTFCEYTERKVQKIKQSSEQTIIRCRKEIEKHNDLINTWKVYLSDLNKFTNDVNETYNKVIKKKEEQDIQKKKIEIQEKINDMEKQKEMLQKELESMN